MKVKNWKKNPKFAFKRDLPLLDNVIDLAHWKKYRYPHGRSLEIPRGVGGGGLKSKLLEEKYN